MSLINNRNEESTPEFEVISGGKEDVRSSFADRTEQEAEIDLIDLAWALLDKIHYIVLCFLIGAVIMNAYSYFLVRPTYKSTAKMYVVSASKNSVVDLDALNIGTSLTADYEQLMLSYPVLEQVINKLNLDMDSDTLAKMITLENPTDTRILNINVVSTDPKSARDIANTLMDVSVDYLLGRTDEPQTVGGHSINTGDITGDNNANINAVKEKNSSDSDETIAELVTVFKTLTFCDKAKVMSLVAELSQK